MKPIGILRSKPIGGSRSEGLGTAGRYLLMAAIALLMIGPFLWLLSTALKSGGENIFSFPPRLLPEQPTLENFGGVWGAVPFSRYFLNSLLVSLLTVAVGVSLAAMAAYPLARMAFRGREVLFTAVLSTMMVPFPLLMIPLYLLCRELHLLNSYWGVILPTAVSAFGIFLLKQAYEAVPVELEDAALIDGANRFTIWWYVMLPLIRPSLATLAIFDFVAAWGDFLWPLIVLQDPQKFTLPLGISYLMGTFSSNWRYIAAGSVLSIIPIVVVFLLLQRYFIEGTAGAVKG